MAFLLGKRIGQIPRSPQGSVPLLFLDLSISTVLTPRFFNLKNLSYSKSKTIPGVEDKFVCSLFLQVFTMVSIIPCYSSLFSPSLSITGSSIACAVIVKTSQGSPSGGFLFPQFIYSWFLIHSHDFWKPGEAVFDVTKSILDLERHSIFWIISKGMWICIKLPNSPIWKAMGSDGGHIHTC